MTARRTLTAAGLAGLALAAVVPMALSDGHSPLVKGHIVGSDPLGPVLFGAKPGGRPWVVAASSVRVSRGGDVRVRGFVIPTAPFNGTNPVPKLAASVVCNGAIAATTAAVDFSAAGDALIDAHVMLPDTCLAPAVLLNPNAAPGTYIGANG